MTALLREHSDNTHVIRALAVLEAEQGDYLAALDLETRLAELGENIPELSYNIGLLLQQAELHDEAAEAFRRATEQKPACAEALASLGHTMQALGQDTNARHCWREAVEAMPELASTYFGPTA